METAATKKRKLTQEDCDTVRLLLARRRTLKEIAEIIEVDPSTVGKIRLAGFDLQTYLEQRKAMNRKTKENKQKEEERREKLFIKNWPESTQSMEKLIGQMEMDLKDPSPAAQDDTPEKPEMSDQTKMMRFIAHQFDRLIKRLDALESAIPKGGY